MYSFDFLWVPCFSGHRSFAQTIYPFFVELLDIVVHLLSCVQLFVTLWTAAEQASLSFTISWSLLKLMSIELVMPSNYLSLCHPLFLLPSVFLSIRVFSMSQFFTSGGQNIGLQL